MSALRRRSDLLLGLLILAALLAAATLPAQPWPHGERENPILSGPPTKPMNPVPSRIRRGLVTTRIVLVPAYHSDQTPQMAPDPRSLDNAGKVITDFWREAADGQLTISYGLSPVFKIPQPTGNCTDKSWEQVAQSAAVRAGLRGDRWMYWKAYDNTCPYGGDAAIGGSSMRINAGGSTTVAAHELGHSLGLAHSRGVQFIGAPGDIAHAMVHEYGGISVMGGGLYADFWDRLGLTWVSPGAVTAAGRGVPPAVYSVGARTYITVRRADGLSYAVESVPAGNGGNVQPGLHVTSNYWGHSYIASLLTDGATYDDVSGGVRLRRVSATAVEVSTSTPPPVPTIIHSGATPTPRPTISSEVATPLPTPCFAGGIIRCTPTPTATATFAPPPSTPTMTPTPSATAAVKPTVTPVPDPPTSTSTPTAVPAVTMMPTRTPVPPSPLPTPHHGCRGFGATSIMLIVSGLVFWKRKLKGESE